MSDPVTPVTPTTPTVVNDTTTPGGADPSSTPSGQMPQTPTTSPSGTEQVDFKDLPASWQNHVKSLREENKNYRLAEENRSKEAAQAQEKKLKDQAEWQTLAEQRESEVNRLKPFEDEAKALNTLLLNRYKAEVEKWPDEVKATMPKGDGVTATQMGEWLDSHKPLAEKLLAATQTRTPAPKGNPSGPVPTVPGNRPAASNDQPLVNFRL